MATRSLICKENEDGRLIGIYCGHDSYVAWVGKILFKNYNTKEKLEELLNKGDVCCLEAKVEDCDFYMEEDTQAKTYENTEKLLDEWGYIDFLYIFKQSSKWIVYENFGNKRQLDLEEALKNLWKEEREKENE